MADLESLRQFGLQAEGGAVHRVAYSQSDSDARDWLISRFRGMGLDTYSDAAGNSFAFYRGKERLHPIGIGSHSDTVPYGGAYDGALGVVAALAVIQALHDAGERLTHPLQWVNFAAEEATMGGGTTGSQAMTGIFNMQMLNKACLLYTSPSPRDGLLSRMPSSA